MDDVFVAALMSSELTTVEPDTLVEDAAQTMLKNGISSVVVTDGDDHLEGILTTTDFVRIVAERKPKDRTPVSDYMTREVKTARAGDAIYEAAETLLDAGIHHLPVVDDDNRVIGILTTTDLTAYVSKIETPA